MLRKEIASSRAVGFILSSIVISLLIALGWYNLPGWFLFRTAKDTQIKGGCVSAVKLYEDAVAWNPKIEEARKNLARCYIELQRYEDAVGLFEALQPTLLRNADYWAELAQIYYASGNSEAMIAAVNRAAALNPTDTQALSEIGQQLFKKSNYDEAEEVLRAIRIHNDNDDKALFWLAWTLYKKREHTDALGHFIKCLEQIEDISLIGKCYAGKAFSLSRLGRPDESNSALLDAYNALQDKAADFAGDLIGWGNASEAESLMRVVRYSPNADKDDFAIFWLAWALYEQKKYNDALYHFDLCINRIKGNDNYLGRCYAGRGFTLVSLGQLIEARQAFEASLNILPEQPDVQDKLSQLP